MFSENLQLELPDHFPESVFREFMRLAKSILLTSKGDPWKEFAGASNLIGWRFRACDEYLHEYLALWPRTVDSFEAIYAAERALFGLYSSAVSCMEGACYAIAALASHPEVLGLPFGQRNQRHCSPKWLQSQVAGRVPRLAASLSRVTEAREWSEMRKLRNRMNHRSNLPRMIRGTVGGPAPRLEALDVAATSSTQAVQANEDDLRARVRWLSQTLADVLQAACELVPAP